jgi:hypothetical protein
MARKTTTRTAVATRVPHRGHPKCRPGKTAHGTKALQLRPNGRWGKDDGGPGLAFIGTAASEIDPQTATVWVANCSCKIYLQCPLAKALAYAGDRYEATTVERRRRAQGRKIRRPRAGRTLL